MGYHVARWTFDHMVLAVPIDTRPGDMALEDIDKALIARMSCEDASMGVSQDLRYELGWDESL